MDFQKASSTMITFWLQFKDNEISLKTNHDFYLQIQGPLEICNLPWCDLVVHCKDPYQLHVELSLKL